MAKFIYEQMCSDSTNKLLFNTYFTQYLHFTETHSNYYYHKFI